MPEFQSFSITLDPANLTELSEKAHNLSINMPNKYNNDAIQARSVAETFNMLQQAQLFQNPNAAKYVLKQANERDQYLENDNEDSVKNSPQNIYGKINNLQNSKDKVLEDYRKNSIQYSNRLNNLYIQIGDKVINTNKDELFLKKVANKYNITHNEEISKDAVTTDMVIDYIQSNYDLIVSDQQRNFLRTQLSQSGIAGSVASFTQTNGIVSDINSPEEPKITLIFDKNKKLDKINIVEKLKGVEENAEKSATATVVADISNLKSNTKSSSKKEVPLEDYLPKYSPTSVKIQYESKDLPVNIEENLHKVMKKAGVFQGTSYNSLKIFMQKKYSEIGNSISNTFSGKKQQNTREH